MNLSVLKSLKSSGVQRALGKTFGKALALTNKYSPEILTTVGVVGVGASAVFACKSTLHLEDVLEESKLEIHTARGRKAEAAAGYGDKEFASDMIHAYTGTIANVVKLYGPSVTLGIVSVGCIIGAHGIMRRRNVALVAAYQVIEKQFSKYRERVIEEFGEDKDRDFRLNLREETRKNEETGKDETVKVHSVAKDGEVGYGRYFDRSCPNWNKHEEANRTFLTCQQTFANQKLQANGHVLLNDIYDALGMERTKEGAVVGWSTKSEEGDGFIDFGIYNHHSEEGRQIFMNEHDGNVFFLDFNVDGVVYHLI